MTLKIRPVGNCSMVPASAFILMSNSSSRSPVYWALSVAESKKPVLGGADASGDQLGFAVLVKEVNRKVGPYASNGGLKIPRGI
ncbi:hypothetical protein [Acidisarcina polymorpha]|uniref:hypothetical protein n=1 Tax=Acidisarcina polymorpha TaxID=2211140 RepID=UPI000DEFD5F1|nr:hypothetical protein [Acidisarcina polymorpha]